MSCREAMTLLRIIQNPLGLCSVKTFSFAVISAKFSQIWK